MGWIATDIIPFWTWLVWQMKWCLISWDTDCTLNMTALTLRGSQCCMYSDQQTDRQTNRRTDWPTDRPRAHICFLHGITWEALEWNGIGILGNRNARETFEVVENIPNSRDNRTSLSFLDKQWNFPTTHARCCSRMDWVDCVGVCQIIHGGPHYGTVDQVKGHQTDS